MKVDIQHITDLEDIAIQLLAYAQDRKVWFFTGRIGAGKTTLIQRICQQLEVTEDVTSPTYALVNVYTGTETIYHLDLYRLESVEEALSIGIEEYLYSGQYCLVEWPEVLGDLGADLAPLRIHLEINPDSSRKILLLEE